MHESEVTLKLAIPNFSLSTSTEAQKSIRHKKNRYFLQEEEFVDDFFPVLASARTTEKRKRR